MSGPGSGLESTAVRIFCSYSHKDEEAREALWEHLSALRHDGLIEAWDDRRITPGEDWSQSIEQALEAADLVLLLVSRHFLASDYCQGIELRRALERAAAGEARVIPIFVHPVHLGRAPFLRYQGLPIDGKAVTKWHNRDEAWEQVVAGIERAALELLRKQPPQFGWWRGSPGTERPALNRYALPATSALLLALPVWFALPWLPLFETDPPQHSHPPPAVVTDPPLTESTELKRRLGEGRALLHSGRYGQALKAYEQALRQAPNDPAALLGREKAALFADLGPGFDADTARRRLESWRAAHPKDPHIPLMLARLDAIAGDSASARARYQRVLELDREVAQAHFSLGVLAHGEGRLKEARGHYADALKLAPSHRLYLTNQAGLLLQQGDAAAALALYERLLRLNPELLLARLDAGKAALLAGSLETAAGYYDRLPRDLARSGFLEAGDNAAQWLFDLPGGELTMDTPAAKRAYTLLSVALTRWLSGDREGALALRERATGLREWERAQAVLSFDLERLEAAHPQWRERLEEYRALPEAAGG